MKEMILIKENSEMAGIFDTKTLFCSVNSKGQMISVLPGVNVIEMTFPFEPLYETGAGFNWDLDLSLAKKGIALTGAVADKGTATLVLTNLSDDTIFIHENEPVVKVSFFSKSVIKAVNPEKTKGIVDLNSKD